MSRVSRPVEVDVHTRESHGRGDGIGDLGQCDAEVRSKTVGEFAGYLPSRFLSSSLSFDILFPYFPPPFPLPYWALEHVLQDYQVRRRGVRYLQEEG